MKLIVLLFLACTVLSGNSMASENKVIYGYVEKAMLVDKNLIVSAKLDTGAKSSSLSAINIHDVLIKNVKYLQFTVPTKMGNVQFLSEYLGKVKIKARAGENGASEDGDPIRRPIVLVRVQLGDVMHTIKVNLTNRKRFLYPLLLGRDAITQFSGIIDPSRAFVIRTKEVEKNEVK